MIIIVDSGSTIHKTIVRYIYFFITNIEKLVSNIIYYGRHDVRISILNIFSYFNLKQYYYFMCIPNSQSLK